MGIAVAMGVCFSIGLMQAQYVALRSKSGRKESTSAAESIASQDLSALARNVPPNIAMTQVAQEDRVQVLRIGIRVDIASDLLLRTIKAGDVAKAESLAREESSSIGEMDADGNTDLHLSAARGFSAVVGTLIDRGCDVDAVNHLCCSALLNAASWGHLGPVQLLLAVGADANSVDGVIGATALFKAAMVGFVSICTELVEARAGVEAKLGAMVDLR